MKNQPNLRSGPEKKKGASFFIGLSAASSIVLAAFTWTDYHYTDYETLNAYDSETLFIEVDELPIYKPEKQVENRKTVVVSVFKVVKEVVDPQDPKPDPEPEFDPEFDPNEWDLGDNEIEDFVLVDGNGKATDFMKVEKKPYWKNCADPLNEMAQAQCTAQSVMRFVAGQAIYPEICVKAGIQGIVKVTFVIDVDGKVSDLAITQSVDKRLDKAAMEAVAKLPDFIPGMQQGRKVPVRFEIPVSFKLQ